MTDEYGTDPHGQDSLSDPGGESNPESWVGDAPVDDFGDPQNPGETATFSEETGSEDIGPPIDEVASTPARRGKSAAFVPVIGGLGILLALGGLLYFQFGGSSSPSQPSMAVPAPPSVAPPTTAATVPSPASVPPSGTTAGSDPLDIANLKAGAPASPEEITAAKTALTSEASVPASPGSASVSPSNPNDSATPVDILNLVNSGTPPAEKPASNSPPLPVASASPSPPPVTAPPASPARYEATDARIASLSMRVDELKSALDHATRQLDQMGASAITGSGSNLDERLNKIEQKLAQMQHSGGTRKSSVMTEDQTDESVTPQPRKTRAVRAESRRSKPVRKTKQETASHSWVLRAATPTEAWVSTDPYSPELRHVQIGDQLPSIGRVNAIRQTGTGWVLEGTFGNVQ